LRSGCDPPVTLVSAAGEKKCCCCSGAAVTQSAEVSDTAVSLSSRASCWCQEMKIYSWTTPLGISHVIDVASRGMQRLHTSVLYTSCSSTPLLRLQSRTTLSGKTAPHTLQQRRFCKTDPTNVCISVVYALSFCFSRIESHCGDVVATGGPVEQRGFYQSTTAASLQLSEKAYESLTEQGLNPECGGAGSCQKVPAEAPRRWHLGWGVRGRND
jgi:hypothetical protein